MNLSSRQSNLVFYDDQGPAFSNRYEGKGWSSATNFGPLYYNGTATWTNVSGDSFSLTFNGSQATLIGCTDSIPTNSSLAAPSASYYVDGAYAGIQTAFVDPDFGQAVYMETEQLMDGAHTINAAVKEVSDGYYFCIDYLEAAPNSETSAPAQNMTKIIAGSVGAIGGLIILTTLITVYCLLSWKRSYGQSEQGIRGTIYKRIAPSTEHLEEHQEDVQSPF